METFCLARKKTVPEVTNAVMSSFSLHLQHLRIIGMLTFLTNHASAASDLQVLAVKLMLLTNKTGEEGRTVGKTGTSGQMDVQAEEEFLCDTQQAGPNGHDQQTQSTEHMDGEIRGS